MEAPSVYKIGTLAYTKPKLAILFFWLLWGDFCYVMMEAVTPSIMPLKLKGLGASDSTMALVLTTIPWTMGLFLNPIISVRSDRFRSRWGRRIPFIVFTLPFLLVCLVGLGFGDKLGFWLHRTAGEHLAQYTPETVAIWVLGVLLVVFTFFNWVLNAAFWYLFNDVVPEQLMARFMAWFRAVGLISVSIYNFCIFRYAESHTAAIFIGAALVYLLGLGSMALFVKEGEYPPPPPFDAGKTGPIAAIKTYARECHGLPHYWFQFLSTAIGSIGGAAVAWMVFFYKSIGMDNAQIGNINGTLTVSTAITILGSGWLADRIHPMRVVVIGVFASLFISTPAMMIWLFWQPSPETAFWTSIGIAVLISAPVAALVSVWDPPLFMRLFPRSRYGQFCSANSLWRAAGTILGGQLAGFALDTMRQHVGDTRVYLFIPVWQFIFTAPVAFLVWKLYKSWQRYGGDENYVPPLPPQMASVPEPEPANI